MGWIAEFVLSPILVGCIMQIMEKKISLYSREEKGKYYNDLKITIETSFYQCAELYINDPQKIRENYRELSVLIRCIHKVAIDSVPPVNIDPDKNLLKIILKKVTELEDAREKAGRLVDEETKEKEKLQLLEDLKKRLIVFCFEIVLLL